jgi:hypothetical protein
MEGGEEDMRQRRTLLMAYLMMELGQSRTRVQSFMAWIPYSWLTEYRTQRAFYQSGSYWV